MSPPFIPNNNLVTKQIPVFALRKVVAVTLNDEWTPDPEDQVFMATVECDMKFNDGTAFPFKAYFPIGIAPGAKFTFDASQSILVM